MTNKEIYDEIYKNLKKEYELVVMDYNDEMDMAILDECIEKQDIQPYFESVDDYMFDASLTSARFYLDEILDKMNLEKDERNEFEDSMEYDELLDTILDRDSSTASEDIFKSTRAQGRIVLNSNFESINADEDNFEYKGGYLRTMIDLLNLNPQLVKQEGLKQGYTFLGRWPNLKSRNGKEVIKYEDVFRFIKDCWYCSQLTFVGRFEMDSLYKALCKGSLDSLTIPKGTTFIAFSSWLGFGGENEFETINDLNIGKANKKGLTEYDKLYVVLDEDTDKHGYTTTDTYGGAVSDEYLLWQ